MTGPTERATISATVHPGVKRLIFARADELHCSVGYLIETMVKSQFGADVPARFRPGERIDPAWQNAWPDIGGAK